MGSSARVFDYSDSDDDLPVELEFPNGVRQTFEYRTIDDPDDEDNDGETQEPTHDILAIKGFPPASSDPTLLHLAYDYDDGPPYDPTSDQDQTGLRQRIRDLTTGGITTEYDYDGLNRIVEANENGGSAEYTYTYDQASNLKEVKEGSQTRSYEYNVVNEVRCGYSGAQQADCPSSDDDYTYDDNGNLTDIENGLEFAYDKRNRTTGITPFGQAEIPFDYADYSQSERLTRGTGSFTDSQLGTQIEEQGSSQTFYDRTDSGQALATRTPGTTGSDYYYLFDSMGSTMGLTNPAGQLVGQRYRYEPYGEQISGPSSDVNPIRFQSQYLDTETSLYKMGQRYYDPTVGRWTQKDPLNLFQDPSQANRYAYVGGDPVNHSDPSGLFFVEVDIGPLGVGFDSEEGPTAEFEPSPFQFPLGVTAGSATGEADPGVSVGGSACFLVCLGVDSDTGAEASGGFNVEFGPTFRVQG